MIKHIFVWKPFGKLGLQIAASNPCKSFDDMLMCDVGGMTLVRCRVCV